jgi:osmotically-inducible protein OsmY
MVLGAGAATGVVLTQERTVGRAVDDTTIWTKIKSRFLQQDVNNLFTKVDVKVTEGRVLLTGNVTNPESRMEAVRIAWSTRGVKEVINEIVVITSPSATSEVIKGYGLDSWITAQIKSKLLLHKNIKSVNYSIETVNHIVYILGIAQNQQELDTVTRIASTVRYVDKVVSHVRLKEDVVREDEQSDNGDGSYAPVEVNVRNL